MPLYLGLLTSNPQGEVDPTKDVVDNFLRWIPEREHVKRRLALDAALLTKPFNQDDLEAFTYLPEQERLDLYYWLTGLSFVYPQEGRFRYHELAQDLFSRHLYQRSKKEYYTTRRGLAATGRIRCVRRSSGFARAKSCWFDADRVGALLPSSRFVMARKASRSRSW